MRDKTGRGRGRGRYPRGGRDERQTQKDEEEARMLAAVSHLYSSVLVVSHGYSMSSFDTSFFSSEIYKNFQSMKSFCIANKDAWVRPA